MEDTIIIYHSADFDGIGSREVFKYQFPEIPDENYIGWDFGNQPLEFPDDGRTVIVVDLNPGDVFGEIPTKKNIPDNLIWIDHHISAINSHPTGIKGVRIDGVAACRLAWQWCKGFKAHLDSLPNKEAYVERTLVEPLLFRLLGEFDIWDKRDPRAEALQMGLRSVEDIDWKELIENPTLVNRLVEVGKNSGIYRDNIDEMMMSKSFMVEFEGLLFLALNGRGNSLTFKSRDLEELGHDALMMFYFDGSKWTTSLYHANHNKEVDLSVIAKKHGGGGHKGACGFQTKELLIDSNMGN